MGVPWALQARQRPQWGLPGFVQVGGTDRHDNIVGGTDHLIHGVVARGRGLATAPPFREAFGDGNRHTHAKSQPTLRVHTCSLCGFCR